MRFFLMMYKENWFLLGLLFRSSNTSGWMLCAIVSVTWSRNRGSD